MIQPAVHLILGEEQFLAERVRSQLIAQIGPEIEHTTVRTGDLTEAEMIDLTSPSLFSPERIVVFTHTAEAGKEPTELLLRTAVDPGEGITMIIHHTGGGRNKALVKKFEKISQVHRVDKPTKRDLPSWVMSEFRSHGVRCTPDVVHALLEGVGSDLRELASAISQLVADSGGNVTVEAVRSYYGGVAEVSGFDIADMAIAGKTSHALASTRRALQLGVSPVQLSAALGQKVGAVARLHTTRGGNPRQLAGVLEMPPFAIEKVMPIARRWSPRNVSKAVMIVADLDARVKGAGGDIAFAVEDAVRQISELAR